MSDQHDENASGAKADATRPDVPDAARRRFATAGLIAPAILTLSGRTAWATGWGGDGGGGGGGRNCSESGMLSGNISDISQIPCGGEGCSPGFWKNNTSKWHHVYLPDLPFNMAFPNGQFANAFPGASLRRVCAMDAYPALPSNWEGKDGAFRAFGAHAVAALQNAATELSYFYTTVEVFNIFNVAYSNGTGTKQGIVTAKGMYESKLGACPFSMHS